MSNRKPKLNSELIALLTDESMKSFTVLNLRDEYEKRYGLKGCRNKAELRSLVYRRVLALQKKGYVLKAGTSQENEVFYTVSDKLYEDYSDGERAEANACDDSLDFDQIKQLKSRLNQYEIDMLSCTGECEEYRQLAKDYPFLRKQIAPLLREARESSSELLGKMKAINNLLQETGNSN